MGFVWYRRGRRLQDDETGGFETAGHGFGLNDGPAGFEQVGHAKVGTGIAIDLLAEGFGQAVDQERADDERQLAARITGVF